MTRNITACCLAAGLLLLPVLAQGQAPASAFVSESLFDSANGMTAIEFDHAGRLIYAEKQGRLMLLTPDGSGGFVTPPTVFADLVAQIDSANEAGLLGLTLDPDYANNRYLYVFFTTPTDQRLVRLTAETGFTSALAGSQTVLLSGLPRDSTIHKAGDIHFAPSDPGAIVISIGDDGNASLAQTLTDYRGKILRVDAATGLGLPDNPFFDGDPSSVRSRIFAIGFRNPFRLAFHPDASDNRILYSSENGDSTDRLSFVRRGSNGAWSPAGDNGGFLAPPDPNHRVLATWNPSVVGVAISNGGPFGSDVIYWGQWQGNIRRWQLSGPELETATALDGGAHFFTAQATIDFQFGPDGHLYSCSTGGGASTGGFYQIRRLRYTASAPPIAAFATSPQPPSGSAPLAVQFTDQSTAPGSSIVQRHWQFGDGGSATISNPAHVYSDIGVYQARLTVTNAAGQQATAMQTVSATRNVQVSFSGTVLDARTLSAAPLAVATELRFYQADGITAASFAGGGGASGNVLLVPPGGVNAQAVTLNLTSATLVISAGESASDGVLSARRGWTLATGSGPHLLNGDFYLGSSMIRGRVLDRRMQPQAVDVGIRRGNGAAAVPYAVSGGRDYLPGSGLTATGVAHRVMADASGWYHLPLRDADASGAFQIDAVADTGTLTHAPIAIETPVTAQAAVDLDLLTGLWSGGVACDELGAITPTPSVDYANQIQPIWDQSCIGCHTASATNSAGLDLTNGLSLAHLLTRSDGAPGVPRVYASRPEASFLMEKVNCAGPQHGTRMRPTNAMSLAEQALIRDWISQLPAGSSAIFADGFE